MGRLEKYERKARTSPTNVTFAELRYLCVHHFGEPTRETPGSHTVFPTPWEGDPRVNIQVGKAGKAKPYQVKQVVKAIERMKEEQGDVN